MKFPFFLSLWLVTFHAYSAELKLVTLNLHGHHPMDEERRVLVYPTGKEEVSWSHLFYFQREELARGLAKRQTALAQHLAVIQPDIVFFQEVASTLGNELHCDSFNRDNSQVLDHEKQ